MTTTGRESTGLAAGALALLAACGGSGGGGDVAPPAAPTTQFGETPAVALHLSQADVDAGLFTAADLIAQGAVLFGTAFNTLDGAGRPGSTGTGAPRAPQDAPHNFNRVSGPDSNACTGCHGFPFAGGSNGNSANVFVLAESFPYVNFDEGAGDAFQEHFLDDVGVERATVGLFGAGWIELLAREMTAELHAIRDQALLDAAASGVAVTAALTSKGVDFGDVTALPNGTLDTGAVDGVDGDLVVKPFHQKGVVVSLREFTNNALNQHHGMQTAERFGPGLDPDGDGATDELTAGDVTALALFQATLPVPGRRIPSTGGAPSAAVTAGQSRFEAIGCAGCHVPALPVADPTFAEPGPYNPPGNLQLADVPQPFAVDLTTAGPGPRLEAEPSGVVLVPAFTDLKRHDMGPDLDNELLSQGGVPTNEFLTAKLWGLASQPPYLHHGRALTLREAILMHGGEAEASRQAFEALTAAQQETVIEFLRTLQVLEPGSPSRIELVPDDGIVGEEPTLQTHVAQADVDAGVYTAAELFLVGAQMFDGRLSALDGAGRPESTGTGDPRPRRDFPQNFNRISGPDSNACVDCHNVPRGSGGGDNVHNVHVLAEALPFVNFDGLAGDDFQDLHLDTVSNERATIGVFGAGWIELLAREMTVELHALRDQALVQAQAGGTPVVVPLAAKGVSFGSLTANPDGTLDASGVAGVDPDLVVKPFHQKGVVVSIREFSTTAMNQHHGMQAVERFGAGTDPDADGVFDELTVGDMTAFAVYQAMLSTPGRLLPSDPGEMAEVQQGEQLFDAVGCAVCHVPELVLDDPVFTEPNPFNPPAGNLTPADVPQPFGVDLTVEGKLPRLPAELDGTVRVPAFTDLKRHDLGPALAERFAQGGAAPEEFLTKKLWGMANEPPYMHHGRATTITEAIRMHGGEAQASRDAFLALPPAQQASVIRFLKTLVVHPDGSPLIVFE